MNEEQIRAAVAGLIRAWKDHSFAEERLSQAARARETAAIGKATQDMKDAQASMETNAVALVSQMLVDFHRIAESRTAR